jgi:putative ABC transport system permease protein
LITSGSLVQTFMRLLSGDAGISTERVTTFELSLPLSSYKDDNDMVAFYRNLLATLRTMPQVEAAGLTEMIPLDGAADFSGIRIPGRSRAKSRELPIVNYTIASPGFFSALGTSLLRGRPFLDSDVALSQPVAIVNRTMAAKFWPGVNPLGKQVGLASSNYPLMTIVGVVADVKHLSLREDPSPEVFVPYTQNPFPSMRVMHFIVRAKSLPAAFDRSLASAVHSLDAGLPVADMRTLQTIVDSSVARPRFATLVVGGLAAVSLVLACFGIYGVIAYSVKQRTREIGVRLALGAERAAVLRLVIGEGARLSGLGISIGLLAAAALTRLLSGLLFGVEPLNFAMFAAASALLLAIALLACYLPALRATRIDPIVALRYE